MSPEASPGKEYAGNRMDEVDVVTGMIIRQCRDRNVPLREAAELVRKYLRGSELHDLVDPALIRIQDEQLKHITLDTPAGVVDHNDETRQAAWYAGPIADDIFWPFLRKELEQGSLAPVVEDIDVASTKVVAQLADPHRSGLKKKGLVLGYVQSGKTANYTAVMAKAADAGYRFFIVLSGMHNNLRRQTQIRVSGDLGAQKWHKWTTEEDDFGGGGDGTAILASKVPSLAVVKKNKNRLEALRDWLRQIPEDVRRRVPILLLDDEADQATPSTAKLRSEKRGINKLVNEIWDEVRVGTYLAYTATPFANVFMDPEDEEDLYPSDFIIDLPRPNNYFGAEQIMGRDSLGEDDEPDLGLDMVRSVADAEGLRPPSNPDEREVFDPPLPSSLVDAVRWFVLATAIRETRGAGGKHSSMLIHTTHYVHPHFSMEQRVEDLLESFREEVANEETGLFFDCFLEEVGRVWQLAPEDGPEWELVESLLAQTLEETRVVVDNGDSTDRLDYASAGSGRAEKVIAIGGGTLSRGLTLEGLVVSYFTRTSNTYDTLLQMGRWFGFRPGYEDLPRLWMQDSLESEYRFLALVEEEIRREIRYLEQMGVTPRELGVRVRAHPGRLAIVSRAKMGAAKQVELSYSGKRVQTFIFDTSEGEDLEVGGSVLAKNVRAARSFVQTCDREAGFRRIEAKQRWLAREVESSVITKFLRAYTFHRDQLTMDSESIIGWIDKLSPSLSWNVAVVGSSRGSSAGDGGGRGVDIGLGEMVTPVVRAPLRTPDAASGTANIKALMSPGDWFLDLDPAQVNKLKENDVTEPRKIRAKLADGHGLVVLYPVSKDSKPATEQSARSRRAMDAKEDLIGVGIIFPDTDKLGMAGDGDYFAVPTRGVRDVEDVEEEEEPFPQDLEGTAGVPELVQGERVHW